MKQEEDVVHSLVGPGPGQWYYRGRNKPLAADRTSLQLWGWREGSGEVLPSEWFRCLEPEDAERLGHALDKLLLHPGEVSLTLDSPARPSRKLLLRAWSQAEGVDGVHVVLLPMNAEAIPDEERLICETVASLLVTLDVELRVVRINRKGLDLLGYRSSDELRGRDWVELCVPEEDRRSTRTHLKALLHGAADEPMSHENHVLCRDGRRLDISWQNALLRDTAQHVVGVIGSGQDVTGQRLMARSLKRREAMYQSLAEDMPVYLAFFLPDGRLLYVNRALSSLFPAEVSDWSELNFWAYLSEGEKLRLRKGLNALSPISPLLHHELVWFPAPASKEYQVWVFRAFFDERGEIIHIQGVGQDITARKKAEMERQSLQERLAQVQKLDSIGRLAGGVAHDFNNMLQVILSQVELAEDALSYGEDLTEPLSAIRQAADRARTLTRQLLAFARKQTVNLKVLDINEAIGGMLSMLERLIGENIRLHWKPGEGVSRVRMDSSQLDQLLTNLSVNARDAIAGNGHLSIETQGVLLTEDLPEEGRGMGVPAGKYVVVVISDDGCGMSPEVLAHLFEPFFSTKGDNRGTGLGLATVYGIVRQNNGYIRVYSEEALGTTFRIFLPVALSTATADSSSGSGRVGVRGGTETILLVEDEPMILNITRRMLSKLGYAVHAYEKPEKAVDQARELGSGLDLVVTDVIMPDLNGRELVQQIRRFNPQVACLYMSGYTSDVIARQGVLAEGISFLQKPFSFRDLAVAVRQALEQG